MSDFNNVQDNSDDSTSIEEILREQSRLEKLIQEKFKKELTILFTDICGYTHYMETMGDIVGRSMLQRHNDIVFPLIQQYDGVVIKTIGDAVMATFEDPQKGVQTAIDIQKALYAYNDRTEPSNQIHVKIGLNNGNVIMEKSDVFGDAVNVAARIQAKAGKDEILISKNLYEKIAGCVDILCRYYDIVELKGKSEPMEMYKIIWRDEETIISDTPHVRTSAVRPRSTAATPTLYIEVGKVENRVKISAYEQERGESRTVLQYDEIPVSMEKIDHRCKEIVSTLNKVNREGRVTRDILNKIREIGQIFSDDLLTPDIKNSIAASQSDHLIISMDDNLVHVPWELLHDGKHFLCQRFGMGRIVRTRQTVFGGGRSRTLGRPLKMLILADPSGDLKEAYQEGIDLRDHMDANKAWINASLQSQNVPADFIREKIRYFDFVHFAGHAEYVAEEPGKSGWRLTNGILTSSEIIKMTGGGAMPSFIFSNACQSARTDEWVIRESSQDEIFGLANAFVLAGVKHYIGTFWEVLDEPSRRFALEFYRFVLSGMSVGCAVQEARKELIREYGEETIVWASYLLYGDPTFNYLDHIRKSEASPEAPSEAVSMPEATIRAAEDVIDFGTPQSKPKPRKNRRWLMSAAIFVFALIAVFFWGYPKLFKEDLTEYENKAFAYYQTGDFENALSACDTLEKKDDESRIIYIIRGNVYLRYGQLDNAQDAYRKALEAHNGTIPQRAEAFAGLGRIASLQKNIPNALNYYQQAAQVDPNNGKAFLAQALLLQEEGKFAEASKLLAQAQKLSPQDLTITAIAEETRKKLELQQNREKRENVERLVKDLLAAMETTPRAIPSDGWTSSPLTMWVRDFDIQGYSMNESENKLFSLTIGDVFIENSRIHVVERVILDTLLEELKFGTTDLIDRNTALTLGKIMAARLILTGKVIYSGAKAQVSMRIIETETARITTAVSETFTSTTSVSEVAGRLAHKLLDKLNTEYPIRGKIVDLDGNEATINIGGAVGVKVGDKLKIIPGNASLEVIAVQPEKSLAVIKATETPVEQNMRIEIVTEG